MTRPLMSSNVHAAAAAAVAEFLAVMFTLVCAANPALTAPCQQGIIIGATDTNDESSSTCTKGPCRV